MTPPTAETTPASRARCRPRSGPVRDPAGHPLIAAPRRLQTRTYVVGQVAVLEVDGTLDDVAEDLDRAIKLALAEGPRGVVCDLSAVLEGAGAGAVDLLASAGCHVRDWPGVPVAVACPEPVIRAALTAHPLGEHLIVTESILEALSAVRATPVPDVERLHLAPRPGSSRASRDFIARILLDWGLSPLIPSASLVVSELVNSSMIHAGTEIDLCVAWSMGALHLGVRDHGPSLRPQRHPELDLHGGGLSIVADLARALGALPTAGGGKVVWAVLDAPRPPPARPGGPKIVVATS